MAIFKKQGVYWIDYYVGGRRKRERIGPSHKLAENVLHKRKLEIASGKYFPEKRNQNITFKEMADKFMELHGKYKASSWGYMLDKIVLVLGNKRLRDISTSDLQQYYNRKSNETCVATANRNLTLIKSVYNRAKEWGLFDGDNPANRVKHGRETNHRLRFLSEDEIKRLLLVCNLRLSPVVACALMTGMRKGEILNLCWENINLTQGIIYILKSKSGKPREIPIMPQLQIILLGLRPKAAGNVFQLPDITLRRLFTKALADAEIKGFRFHDLRHTFASHFIMRTSNLPVLQQILGHASPQMTQRYAHLAHGHIRMQMQIFASAMPSLPQTIAEQSPSITTVVPDLHQTGTQAKIYAEYDRQS